VTPSVYEILTTIPLQNSAHAQISTTE